MDSTVRRRHPGHLFLFAVLSANRPHVRNIQRLAVPQNPKDRLAYYVDSSLNAGAEAARQYLGADLEELYRKHAIEIAYKDDGRSPLEWHTGGRSPLQRMAARCCCSARPSVQLADNSKGGVLPAMDYEQAKNIHRAHEFFHYIEHQNGRFFSQTLDPIVTIRFWGENGAPISAAAARWRPMLLQKPCCICRSCPTMMIMPI